MTTEAFEAAYKNLNKGQREAVDTIEGPVMVVAGPGTGKTQILALRIANILLKTDTQADGILCLTFTNSGVRAMRDRLFALIGPGASKVRIQTFHSFAIDTLSEFFEVLGLPAAPKLLDEKDTVLLIDELLESHEWEYLRPRGGGAHNFRDLKSLFSLLKRERITASVFNDQIEIEIKALEKAPENFAARGTRKGELKKEILEKINRLNRTKETARFYQLYEETKRERNVADYDDVLTYLLSLMETSAEARDTIRERFLYILVDEHQDSSGIQNDFLRAVWGEVEKPNLFVVGDDRQLIYGFGGASLDHFESFREHFNARVVPLTINYRSTQTILDAAQTLLESSLVKDKLVGTSENNDPVSLIEAEYPRDEILAAGLATKENIEKGLAPENCAVLVPKNSQARTAITTLADMGLPVAAGDRASFLALRETQSLITLLRVLAEPYSAAYIAEVLLDPIFRLPTLEAHKFIREHGRSLSLELLASAQGAIGELGNALVEVCKTPGTHDIYRLTQELGSKFFFQTSMSEGDLLKRVEIVRTMLHLILARMEKDSKLTLVSFVQFIDRLQTYGEDIPLAVFAASKGVKVMTMHASKGLEYDFVWIAHLDEQSVMKGKKMAFTLPGTLAEKMQAKDLLTAKRELYVAMTRARKHCTLSYARVSHTGIDQTLASIVALLPEETFRKQGTSETEAKILEQDPTTFVVARRQQSPESGIQFVVDLVRDTYPGLRLAVTHLNNFYSCPWKWYYRNFLRLPEPETEALQFGSLVHAGIEMLFANRKIKEIDLNAELEKKLDGLRIYDDGTRARMLKDAHKVLEQFSKERLPLFTASFEIEKEKKYRDPEIPNIMAVGKIDLLEILGDKEFQVTDFKTGKMKTRGEIEKRDEEDRLSDSLRQLAMYTYLLREEGKVMTSRLMFVEAAPSEKNSLYETQVGVEEIELLRKDIKDYDALLANGEWVNRPCCNDAFGRECEYCKLRKLLS